MNSIKSALLLMVATFGLGAAASFAQVPDDVQTAAPVPELGRSQTEAYKAIADQRTRDIEAVPTDIADLSKFKHDVEYLPKYIYKRDYPEKTKSEPMVAGQVVDRRM